MTRLAATMHMPSAALGACLFGGVQRDTRGRDLNDAERFNHFPANPMAAISFIFEGTLRMVEGRGADEEPKLGPPLPRIMLSGPQRGPLISWAPGPTHVLTVAFYPESLGRLIGQPIEPYIDRHVPLDTVAPPALLQACQAALAAADDEPFAALEVGLRPLWREPGRATPALFLGDWVRSVVARAAHSAHGRSLRQAQRRIRDWTGQSYRELQLFVRVQDAFIRRRDSKPPDFAALAADAGYADQSHMGREIRRVTGFSPARFDGRVESDEAFWYYRLVRSLHEADGKLR